MQAARQPWQTVRSPTTSFPSFRAALTCFSPSQLCSLLSITLTTPQPHFENLTGTRGAFKTYNTTKPKISAWEPKVASRA